MTAGQHECTVQIGVDFGISLTVIAVSIPGQECRTLELPGISRRFPARPGDVPTHGIPSLIRYGAEAIEIGEEAVQGVEEDDPAVARWLRRYLCHNSPVQIPAGDDRMVRYEEAAKEFLTRILDNTLRQFPGAGMIFTIPQDAPENYADFLRRVARSTGARSIRIIGEYQAALAGCRVLSRPGEPFLVVNFAETGLEAAVVTPGEIETSSRVSGVHVLARATGSVNCKAIDSRIVQDLRIKFRLIESDPQAVRLAPQMRYEAAGLRELLPFDGEREIRLTDDVSKKSFVAVFTSAELEKVLADLEVIPALLECIDRALSSMRMRGGDDGIGAVLLLGSGCALPLVQDAIRSRFPDRKICCCHPLDAIARGAAEYLAPTHRQDMISCSYALRYWDPGHQEHHYRFLVHSGTRYPSPGQVARIIISGVYDGQTHLGIPIYEIGGTENGHITGIELVSDTGGGVHLAGPAQDTDTRGQAVLVNGRKPTLLVANPPARKGEPRFECTFTIDPERNLCLSARDLVTGALLKLNEPVHRLT